MEISSANYGRGTTRDCGRPVDKARTGARMGCLDMAKIDDLVAERRDIRAAVLHDDRALVMRDDCAGAPHEVYAVVSAHDSRGNAVRDPSYPSIDLGSEGDLATRDVSMEPAAPVASGRVPTATARVRDPLHCCVCDTILTSWG
ncbi:hypothetical protein Aduo_018774 [Ancylostoma duodenale]